MLYEDLTIKGAIKKALGKRPPAGSTKPSGGFSKTRFAGRNRVETFDDRSFGSAIGGTGRSGFSSMRGALNAAASEMERLARSTYPNRVRAIQSGERHRAVMIPELAAAIEFDRRGSGGPNRTSLRFDNITVGERDRNGSGRFTVTASPNLAAVLHAHWVDNRPSSDDTRAKSQISGALRGRRDAQGNAVDIGFYIFSLRHGISAY